MALIDPCRSIRDHDFLVSPADKVNRRGFFSATMRPRRRTRRESARQPVRVPVFGDQPSRASGDSIYDAEGAVGGRIGERRTLFKKRAKREPVKVVEVKAVAGGGEILSPGLLPGDPVTGEIQGAC